MKSFHGECLLCGKRVVSGTAVDRLRLMDQHRVDVHGATWRDVPSRRWETEIRSEGLIRRWWRRRSL